MFSFFLMLMRRILPKPFEPPTLFDPQFDPCNDPNDIPGVDQNKRLVKLKTTTQSTKQWMFNEEK
ncbi:hypothetical protein DERP_002710 [Dermatophagoides pteronyssinus]|uniref:Uncharacterized protein n=1 Tax=Dermatophagoides pteronyssinus TaxID=6956 RepID=A0ABQ8JWD7_DERPT|nr:hypothetical protein DERP_002710 [Dermatophagoides pteronyssinus]